MNDEHTPGPWSWQRTKGNAVDSYRYVIRNANGVTMFSTNVDRWTDNCQMDANAQLIAAAPDLLHALRSMVDVCFDLDRNDETIAAVRHAVAAIAKAIGEAP